MAKTKVKAKIKYSDIEAGFVSGLRVLAQLTDSNLESVRITRLIKYIDGQMEEPFAERADWIAKYGKPNARGNKVVRTENLDEAQRKEWLGKIKPWRARTLEVDFNSDHPAGKLIFPMFEDDVPLLPQQFREALVDYVDFTKRTGENPRSTKKRLEAMAREIEALKKKEEGAGED